MCRRFIVLVSLVLMLGLVASARGATLFHWQFDGVEGQKIISDTDIEGGAIAYKFYDATYDANTGYDVNYAEPNPWYNDAGTSADFQNDPANNDPGVGLRVPDPGSDSDLDLSTVSACTIEAFVYPYVNNRQSVIVRKYDGGVYYIDTRGSGKFAVRLAGGGQDTADPNGVCSDPGLKMKTDEWQHVALVWDGSVIKFYVDGVQAQQLGPEAGPYSPTIPFTGPIGDSIDALGIGSIVRDNLNPPDSSGQFFYGRIDEVRISDEALDPSKFLLNETGGAASRPRPRSGSENICDGTSLCWRPGKFAEFHDVYFGTDRDDVNDATTSVTLGVYQGRQDLDANCYLPSLSLGTTYYWRIDEVNTVDPNLWKGTIWEFTTNDGSAYDPDPPEDKTAVPIDSSLSWSPGCLAETHDVYIGTDFNDVNNATTAVTLGVYKGNVEPNEYDPCDFDYFTVHYWRIDEVGAGSQRWKGKVWSFRSISEITDVNFVGWFKLDERAPNTVAHDSSGWEHHANVDGPEEGVNWDANDGYEEGSGSLVFDDDTDMECHLNMMSKIRNGISVCLWLKDADRPGSNNWVFEIPGSGEAAVRAAVVEDSTDQVLWRAGNDTNDVIRWDLDGTRAGDVEGWHHWAFVKNEITDEISIYFDGFVKESNSVVDDTIINVRGMQMRFGVGEGHGNDFEGKMDDIQIYDRGLTATEVATIYRGGAIELAWAPNPGNNAKDVPRDGILYWKPGDYASSHDVYFGTSWDDVNDATTAVTLGVFKGNKEPNEYDPPGELSLNTIYYWRIDEVNDTNDDSPWKGKVWQFTVANFLIVDDMESYDPVVKRIYYTWIDGIANGSGSEVGLGIKGTDPVHLGEQSLKFDYDNDDPWGSDKYSEIYRTFSTAQDWTEAGVKILTLFFHGSPGNDANATEQLYAGLEDTRGSSSYAEIRYGYYGGDMNDIKKEEWTQWDLALADFTGVQAANVKKVYIGFGDRDNPVPGGSGTVYFDDLRLYPPKCVPWRLKPVGDFTDDCIVDFDDIMAMGESWLRTDANLSPVVNPGAANLVGWWKLDENAGSTANDSSVYANHGTISGTYSWVAGHSNSAVQFTNGRVLVPDAAQLRPAAQVSASAWIYYAGDPGDSARVVVKGADNFEAYAIEVSEGQGTYYVGDVNGTRYFADSNEGDVYSDEWVHLAGTYDGATVKFYVNGQVVGTEGANSIPLSQDANGLGIANRSDADNRPFRGTVDEVRVYNRALSAAEVGWLATDGTGYVPLASPLNLYDQEPQGEKAINFRDYTVFLESWLDEKLWPPQP